VPASRSLFPAACGSLVGLRPAGPQLDWVMFGSSAVPIVCMRPRSAHRGTFALDALSFWSIGGAFALPRSSASTAQLATDAALDAAPLLLAGLTLRLIPRAPGGCRASGGRLCGRLLSRNACLQSAFGLQPSHCSHVPTPIPRPPFGAAPTHTTAAGGLASHPLLASSSPVRLLW